LAFFAGSDLIVNENLEDEFAKIEGTTEIQQWKVELLELRKLVEKVYNADAEANEGKVKVFLK
jgi:hypothetical protein